MVYLLIFIITFWCHFVYDGNRKNKRYERFFFLLEFFALFLVAGLRYRVGADSLGYEDQYDNLNGLYEFLNYSFKKSSDGFLWYAFVAFCQSLGKSWLILQLVHSFIVNFAVFRFIGKHCTMPFLAVLLYSVFSYLYFNTEILRASLAVSVFLLWGYDALLEKKWIKYFIFAFISANIHIEGVAIFFLPLAYYIGASKMNDLRLIGVLVGSVILLNVLKIDTILYSFAQYSEAIEYRAGLYTIETERTTNALLAKMIVLTPIFICLWGTKFLQENTKSSKMVRGLIIFYTVGSVLTIYYPVFFSRIIDCVRIIYIATFADVLGVLKKNKQKKSLYAVILALALFCGGFMQYREDVANIRYYPYYSVFNPERVPLREALFTK